jgi:hypothetical protein
MGMLSAFSIDIGRIYRSLRGSLRYIEVNLSAHAHWVRHINFRCSAISSNMLALPAFHSVRYVPLGFMGGDGLPQAQTQWWY